MEMRNAAPIFAAALLATGCRETASPLIPPNGPISAWGDSMTGGARDLWGQNWPDQLSMLTGRTVFNGGIGGETSSQILVRLTADTLHRVGPVILWMGRNNLHDSAQVQADIATAVASVEGHHQPYLVLAITNGDFQGENAGAADYELIVRLDRALATQYSGHFVDVRHLLLAHADLANSQDVIDRTHDVPPSSLRADALHLNMAGYRVLAAALADTLAAKGW
jgi:lysophospholipase L1-like esterase